VGIDTTTAVPLIYQNHVAGAVKTIEYAYV